MKRIISIMLISFSLLGIVSYSEAVKEKKVNNTSFELITFAGEDDDLVDPSPIN